MSLKRMLCCFRPSPSSDDEIPEDLLSEILLRVPSNSVAKFRRLSKSYRDWIDSPDFIRKHYNLRTSLRHIIVIPDVRSRDWRGRDGKTPDYQVVRLDSTEFGASVGKSINSFKENGYSIVDCCVGILCYLFPPKAGRDGHVLVWNPLTGGPRMIDVQYDIDFESSYLFGHDATANDLKILKIRHGKPSHNRISTYHCEIYSCRVGSWRKISGNSYQPTLNLWRQRIFVEGTSSLHMLEPSERKSIIAFDFASEKFNRIALPERSGPLDICGLLDLDGCLCIGNYGMPCETCTNPCWSVWGMKEYGVEESWTWLFCFCDFVSDHPFLVSRRFVNGRRLIFLTFAESEQYQTLLYDFEHKTLIKYLETKLRARCLDPSISYIIPA